MKEINKWIIEYISVKWKSLIGFILITILIIFAINRLNISYKPILTVVAVFLWSIFWILKTGRLLLPSGKYTIVFCIRTDESADRHYKKVLQKLNAEIDSLNASRYFHFIEVAPDIIKNRAQAESYRETQRVDLVIWGNADSETVDGKVFVNFRLNFTCRLNLILKSKLLLFSADLLLITGTKKWMISTDNTLREEIGVSHSFQEACLFIIGIYLLTEDRLEDAIRLLSALKQVIPEAKDDKFRVLIQGRINSILAEAYLLLASEAVQKKDYPKAKKYFLELDKYAIKKFRIYTNLAKIEYYLNNFSEAVNYTKRAALEQRKHPVIYANYAFFRIIGKKYNNALFWYKKIYSLSQVDLDIPGLLEFLEERYSDNKKELAFLFAMGLLNYRFFDKAQGVSDLKKFIAKTEGMTQYANMAKFSMEIIEAEKYRKKIVKKIPGKKR